MCGIWVIAGFLLQHKPFFTTYLYKIEFQCVA